MIFSPKVFLVALQKQTFTMVKVILFRYSIIGCLLLGDRFYNPRRHYRRSKHMVIITLYFHMLWLT